MKRRLSFMRSRRECAKDGRGAKSPIPVDGSRGLALQLQEFEALRKNPASDVLSKTSPAPRAFSLIELLAVMAIILVLTMLYWGPSNASRQRAVLRTCQNNLQKLYIALEIYANDHAGKFPVVTGASRSEAPLNLLVPRYTSDTSSFICPGTKDTDIPSLGSLLKRKISYAYYMGMSLTNAPQVVMSDEQVDTSSKAAGQLVFSPDGKAPGNNHGKYGGNLIFGDGHVQLSPPRTPVPLQLAPGELLLNP